MAANHIEQFTLGALENVGQQDLDDFVSLLRALDGDDR